MPSKRGRFGRRHSPRPVAPISQDSRDRLLPPPAVAYHAAIFEEIKAAIVAGTFPEGGSREWLDANHPNAVEVFSAMDDVEIRPAVSLALIQASLLLGAYRRYANALGGGVELTPGLAEGAVTVFWGCPSEALPWPMEAAQAQAWVTQWKTAGARRAVVLEAAGLGPLEMALLEAAEDSEPDA